MSKQTFFTFDQKNNLDLSSFFVNSTNNDAYKMINNINQNLNIFLIGPNKSGKSHLANIWKKNNNALIYNDNFEEIISKKQNVIIENIFNNFNEETIFHIINHCFSYKLNILITSEKHINDFNFTLLDLVSRIKMFNFVQINNPDDEILVNVITKLLVEKQFIIKNKDIFEFLIKRVNRTYEEVFNLVNKMDELSLEKKRQLTIPSIKKLLY